MASENKSQPVVMELGREERMQLDNMAISMYAERVAEDTRKKRATLYGANPDARQLYFKGIHDTLIVLEEWNAQAIDPNLMALFLEKLHDQTCEDDLSSGATH
jgi:hypothetical protein